MPDKAINSEEESTCIHTLQQSLIQNWIVRLVRLRLKLSKVSLDPLGQMVQMAEGTHYVPPIQQITCRP